MTSTKNKQYKINTPSLVHTKSSDWQFVYEPAEDTFLLLDTLEGDMEYILSQKPNICLEVGSGSGVIITALGQLLNSSTFYLAIDINKYACKLTQQTASHNKTIIDVLAADLTHCLKRNSVDMMIFNPPYVVTPSNELKSKDNLVKSWAGGMNGREIIDQFLETMHNVLNSKGFGYILLLKENDPQDVINIMLRKQFDARIVSHRKIRSEELFVVKFQKSV